METWHKWVIAAVFLVMALVSIGSATAIDQANLTVRYSFDVDGTDDFDNHDLTAQGTLPNIVGGVLNNAQDCTGAGGGDYYEVADNAADMSWSTGWTMSIWLNPDSCAGTQIFSQKAAGGAVNEDWQCSIFGGNYRCAVRNTAQLTVVDNPCSSVGWNHLVFTFDGDELRMWMNGTLVETDTGAGGLLTNGADDLHFCTDKAPTNYYNGLIDETCIWTRNITTAEVAALYNAGSGAACDATTGPTLTVTAAGPADNDHDNDLNRTFNFNVDTTGAGASQSINATLWLNVSGSWFAHSNYTNVEVGNGSDRNTTTEIWVNESSFQWLIEGTVNGSASANSTARTLVIDVTSPVINRHAGEGDVAVDNTTSLNLHIHGEAINQSYNCTDPYMWGMNVTTTLANGTKIYSNQTTAMGGTVGFDTWLQNMTTKPIQQTNVTTVVTCSDDHTSPIPDYQVNSQKSKITFKTPNDNNIKIETDSLSDISADKLTDRYNFTIRFDDGLTLNRTFHVKTDLCTLVYRPNSPYKAHFVSACGLDGNFIDFEGAGDEPIVTKLDDYHYTVRMQVPPIASFQSVGGLNVENRSIVHEWRLEPLQGTGLNGTSSISEINLTWTNHASASFVEVWRGAANIANTTNNEYNDSGLSANTAYTYQILSVYNFSRVYYVNLSTVNNENERTISTQANTSISIVLRDEITKDQLSGRNCTVNLISETFNTTEDTATGAIPFQGQPSNNYTMRHTCADYVVRDQFLELVNNSVAEITLYLLTNNESTVLPVSLTTLQGRVLPGCRINWQRWYTDTSEYSTVEMANTSAHGETNLYYEQENAFYRPIIICGSTTDSSITPRRFTSLDSTGVTWRIDLSEDLFSSWGPIGSQQGNIITYDSATRSFSWVYDYTSSVFSQACLRVWRVDRRLDVLVNTTCSASQSATLVAGHPATTNTLKAVATISTTTEHSDWIEQIRWIESINRNTAEIFGALGLLMSGILIAVLGLVSSAHPAIPIVGGILGLIGGWLGLGLSISTGTVMSIVIVGVGIIILFAWRSGR